MACGREEIDEGPVCGDGIVEEGEVCDNGLNEGRYEGCEPGCAALAPRCGDAVIDDGESCDDGANDGTYDGCRYDCAARAGYCGDAEVTGPERCDDGINDDSYGSCTSDCLDSAGRCGDGEIDGPEQCDDGYNDGNCGSCLEDCSGPALSTFLVEVTVLASTGAYGFPADFYPDLYIEVFDLDDRLLYRSLVVDDQDPPVTFAIEGVQVSGEDLLVQVWDADGGAFGDSDDMGSVIIDTFDAVGQADRRGTDISWLVDTRECGP